MEIKALISKIDIKTKDEILRKTQYKDLHTEDNIVEIAQLVLPFTEDEAFCSAFDYLHCKIEHRNHLQKIREQAKEVEHFDGLFHDLRRELNDATSLIRDYIRYGKRSREIDELLTKFVVLDRLVSVSLRSSTIGEASSRCNLCNKECLASYRIMFGLISSILTELRQQEVKN